MADARNNVEKKEEWIRIRVDPTLKRKWEALCARRGESQSEVGRALIEKAVAENAIVDGVDEIVSIIRSTMKDVLVPHTERLAAINAKTAIAAATSMYMNTQVIANAGHDAKGIYEISRKKAVEFVREKKNT